MDNIKDMVKLMLVSDSNIIKFLLKKADGNEITDNIRKEFFSLPLDEQQKLYDKLEIILKKCYFNIPLEISNLSKEELFSLKESLIYYLGRLSTPNIELLKRIYNTEENKNLLFNITCSSLITFDEEIELDFISRIKPGNDYDLMIRSWTLAFYTNTTKPHEYIDTGIDDFSLAKQARINRLSKNNEKDIKAKAYRLIDLVVISLFLESRGYEAITKDDYAVIRKAKINFEEYSKNKIKKLTYFKEKIINNNPY